jgi:hypothetical protein
VEDKFSKCKQHFALWSSFCKSVSYGEKKTSKFWNVKLRYKNYGVQKYPPWPTAGVHWVDLQSVKDDDFCVKGSSHETYNAYTILARKSEGEK